jgi:hypothetical protein
MTPQFPNLDDLGRLYLSADKVKIVIVIANPDYTNHALGQGF